MAHADKTHYYILKTETSLFIIAAVVYNKRNKIDLSNYIMKILKNYPQNMKKEKKTRYKRFKSQLFNLRYKY